MKMQIATSISDFCEALNQDGTVGYTVRTAYDEYEWAGLGFKDLAQAYEENEKQMKLLSDALENGEPLSMFWVEWHSNNHSQGICTGWEEDQLSQLDNQALRTWFGINIRMMYGGMMFFEQAMTEEQEKDRNIQAFLTQHRSKYD